jgi:hypothetical protein
MGRNAFSLPAALFVLVLGAALTGPGCGSSGRGASLPGELSSDELWRLSTGLSEPAGSFTHSDNLVSNEILFAHTVRQLRPSGGVYIGVGPEQNYSYIARLRPVLAFIIDIRNENRSLHLLYKALFELSADRADFLSLLFSRERPPRLDRDTSVQELFRAFVGAAPSATLLSENTRRVRERLLETHRLSLSPAETGWIEYVLATFHSAGPDVSYGRSRPESPAGPSYRLLMTSTDIWGQPRSFLATEEAFTFVKGLHARNLIVPVVGDFAGSDAIRRTGDYVRQHAGTVRAFYASNVEVYLSKQQAAAFCRNLETLPVDESTWYIGSKGVRTLSDELRTCPPPAARVDTPTGAR